MFGSGSCSPSCLWGALTLPEAHIRGDVNTPYRCIGGAVYTMQSAGYAKVGFISEPPAGTVNPRL